MHDLSKGQQKAPNANSIIVRKLPDIAWPYCHGHGFVLYLRGGIEAGEEPNSPNNRRGRSEVERSVGNQHDSILERVEVEKEVSSVTSSM